MDIRIGMGQDIHALVGGRPLWLGGVKIPFELGLQGHSDADVLIHAIMDAMLGALAMGDIGGHFPDTDSSYKDISSMKLLEQVVRLTSAKGFRIGNLDCMIQCERPKIAPHRQAMICSLAAVLGIAEDRISIKAGTNEGFDAVGEGRAIACSAVVLMIHD